ncbi:response regulator [Levilinea saccharolytica]|uniref:LuxR family transcriptional regulator n=1 Tax=Levilinea saccharolytica TaxID=229921 RepID=A0A0P6XRP4_9CHLR|nr:response regulator transcription factor [Levilinea saccharolytica]KPL77925.1 LuxR family transcriptional regulator [Levilinea saccharolytica]GAP16236.1 two component transcriptional regulator, LuxR family [Levilinea saccharolytica]
MNHPIRILLVDDQALFREGLNTLLSVQPDFEVVGEASNGEEALRLAVQLQPHVILMDLRMPVLDGVTATRRLRTLLPDCRVIVLTTFDDDEFVFDGLRAGAVGYLLKDVSSDKLFEALRAAARGEYFLLPSITAKVIEEFARVSPVARVPVEPLVDPLSAREIEILRLVATGASNKEIAEMLVIAEGTVKNHLTNILAKLSAKDRLQAVLKARELGLLS